MLARPVDRVDDRDVRREVPRRRDRPVKVGLRLGRLFADGGLTLALPVGNVAGSPGKGGGASGGLIGDGRAVGDRLLDLFLSHVHLHHRLLRQRYLVVVGEPRVHSKLVERQAVLRVACHQPLDDGPEVGHYGLLGGWHLSGRLLDRLHQQHHRRRLKRRAA